MYLYRWWAGLLLLCINNGIASQGRQSLAMVTYFPSPYQTLEHDQLEQSVRTLDCVLAQMDMTLSVQLTGWSSALRLLETNMIDGVFALEQHDDLNAIAVASAPILLEKWMWLYRPGLQTSFKQMRLGVIAGSNEQRWLEENGFDIQITADSVVQLLRLVSAGRIDAFLSDRQVLTAGQWQHSRRAEVKEAFARYVPLHGYFSRELLSARPSFINRFNTLLPRCSERSFELNKFELQQLNPLVEETLVHWVNDAELQQAVIVAAEQLAITGQTAEQLDKRWIEEDDRDGQSLRQRVMASRASVRVAALLSGHPEIVEVIVSDQQGFGVGINQPTSDFWQGDEDKFLRATQTPAVTYYSPIRYDASTRRFLVHISRAMLSPKTQGVIGVVTIGVDIGQWLTGERRAGVDHAGN